MKAEVGLVKSGFIKSKLYNLVPVLKHTKYKPQLLSILKDLNFLSLGRLSFLT